MKTITAAELKNKLEQGTILLIDVREPAEYQAEHIKNAQLIPLADLSYNALPTKVLPIVFHCKTGKRSEEACQKLLAENPTLEVYLLEGGIKAWKYAGFSVESAANIKQVENINNSENTNSMYNLNKKIPLDRQVPLATGLLVLLGVLLGMIIHPIFYIICAVTGVALVYIGLTGWSGLKDCLAKRSWNK